MILAQIGMFFMMRKISEPIFNRLFKGSFNAKNKGDICLLMHDTSAKTTTVDVCKRHPKSVNGSSYHCHGLIFCIRLIFINYAG